MGLEGPRAGGEVGLLCVLPVPLLRLVAEVGHGNSLNILQRHKPQADVC